MRRSGGRSHLPDRRRAHAHQLLHDTGGPNVDELLADSLNGDYANKLLCRRFLVDVVVPYNSSPASSSRDVSLRFWTDILDVHPSAYGKAYCETLSETVSIYRKTVNPLIPGGTPSFSLVDTMNVRGVWIDPQPGSFGGACVLEVDDSDCHGGGTDCLIYQASPPVLHGSTTTYRFAMTAELDDVYRRITLLAEHPPIVP